VDPLRAGHVAILGGRFRYFCKAECKQSYLRAEGLEQDHLPTAAPPEVAPVGRGNGDPHRIVATRVPAEDEVDPEDAGAPNEREAREDRRSSLLPASSRPGGSLAPEAAPPVSTVARVGRSSDRAVGTLEGAGIVLGALAPAIGLLGDVADVLRVPLVVAAWVALAARFAMVRRDASEAHPLVVIAPTAGAVVAACWARLAHDPHAVAIASFAGLACAAALAVEALVTRARARMAGARASVESALDVTVRAIRGDAPVELAASDVRAGEQVVVEAGEVVGVDAIVAAGEARVVPWHGARVEIVRREGDPVVAGARVVSSSLRMTTTWSGRDRAWLKLLRASATRIDVCAPTVRALRLTVERGAPVAALLVGVATFAANGSPPLILAAMSAAAFAFGARAVAAIVALHFARAHLEALAAGITYKDARAFEQAAAANIVVMCARGTVLLGEPEIVAIEPLSGTPVERVLALAAGAETGSSHPLAAAIQRAARTRGVRPEPVRNASGHAGLGVTALASTGERLVVGGRAIMLEEKIGVAAVDARVSELEAQGRSVLLVALGDRLAGVLALQDGLRPGARAAVQRLLDGRIEPVLLSGEARETCDTIGRALDIEHVRPEVLPADRGAEIRALAEGGSVVAVVGHPSTDDGALGAADVAVAMGAAGATPGEWAVALASDDVRDAASALAIPHAARDKVRAAIALGATPGVVALLAIGFGIAPLAVAPLAALAAAIAVVVHAKEAAPTN
jgi:Cu+-exporting ATPase